MLYFAALSAGLGMMGIMGRVEKEFFEANPQQYDSWLMHVSSLPAANTFSLITPPMRHFFHGANE